MEIVGKHRILFARLKRGQLRWPMSSNESVSWESVATKMRENLAALCIVKYRRAAKDVFQALQSANDNAVYHLSTTMCPKHRLQTITQVKQRLDAGRRCYLVSTQLIQRSGVDIDFPLVLREMAPLESIIQAAGRCNREGDSMPERQLYFCSDAAPSRTSQVLSY